MIKGISINLVANVKTLVFKATKNTTTLLIHSNMTGVRLGGPNLVVDKGFEMICNEPYTIPMTKDEELYVITKHTCPCEICAIVQE